MTHVHFLGIAGSFMSGLARLALDLGYTVSGSDVAYYPPMGEQARRLNVPLYEAYDADCGERAADLYIIGNAVSRGNPLLESVLRERRPYTSAAQWLAEHVLTGRRVLAVAGTHGKTTTTALLVYLLERAGLAPGFLLGGVDQNSGVSARLSPASPLFVVEADEYDSAFFDKRPKFLHYRPHIAVINNIEFDHADIYPDIETIIRQFHYLLRTVPDNGRLIVRADDANIAAAMRLGVYSEVEQFGDGGDWSWRYQSGAMRIRRRGRDCGVLSPPLRGAVNRDNIIAAVAAAAAAGVDAADAAVHLDGFQAPQRRLQLLFSVNDVRFFDDFAHHPTAMEKTIAALAESRRDEGRADGRIIAVFEPRSNSMKAGIFQSQLAPALAAADMVVVAGTMPWLAPALASLPQPVFIENNAAAVAERLRRETREGDDVLIMSNGDFGGLVALLQNGV